jgi:hypothetical protein
VVVTAPNAMPLVISITAVRQINTIVPDLFFIFMPVSPLELMMVIKRMIDKKIIAYVNRIMAQFVGHYLQKVNFCNHFNKKSS